jgi:hypothetical protein
MELSAGSMIGIRNPHAHENAVLDSDDAKNILYLASLLMKEFKTGRFSRNAAGTMGDRLCRCFVKVTKKCHRPPNSWLLYYSAAGNPQ